MRMLKLAAAALALTLLACGKGTPGGQCVHNFDCPAGQGCVDGACEVLPCGGCQPDEACGTDGKCVAAQGASCADHTCPAGYPCSAGGVCAKTCVVADSECSPLFCVGKSCVECKNNANCAGKVGRPVCDQTSLTCVQCSVNQDCVNALGSGHFCDAHVCKAGCKSNNDCNAGLGETCDTSTSPGRCIQCKTDTECQTTFGQSAGACDDTGHCVQCWGTTQAAANGHCQSGSSECNIAAKTCVQCLPANNGSGLDCGYPNGGTKDPHSAQTCNPATFTCVNGCSLVPTQTACTSDAQCNTVAGEFCNPATGKCIVDAQCGCPRTAQGGLESNCTDPDGSTHRVPAQEHCDPNRTTMAGFSGSTLGACVECTVNSHCAFHVQGSTTYGGTYATWNGARCRNDTCEEMCDSDKDCASGRICHLGPAGDKNNNKCVQCGCDSDGADPSWCNSSHCAANLVCDTDSLNCRKKHEGEECEASSECGALVGIANECPAVTGFCALRTNNQSTDRFCSASHGLPGRCAARSDQQCACPLGSAWSQASNTEGTSGQVCFPASCSYP